MKKKACLFLAISCLVFLGFQGRLWALPQEALKGWMFRFVALAADLRMEGIKTSKPDWQAIQKTLEKMQKNLHDLQKADRDKAYEAYLNELSISLNRIQRMSASQDPDIARAYDGMTQACLQCHSAHLSKVRMFQEPIK